MSNKILWIFLSILVFGYSKSPFFDEIDLIVKQELTFSDRIADDLIQLRTSPRWKYSNANYNAKFNKEFQLVFPHSDLPIINLEIEKDDLFGYTEGIYVIGIEEWKAKSNQLNWWQYPANYKNKGKDWERKAKIQFFGFDENIPTQNIGLRINGNATRAFPQKSLRLLFNNKPIPNYFFKNDKTNSFNTMLLRNAGNDWDRAFMRDIVTQKLSEGLSIETQTGLAVNVYFNGEYWGIHYLRPKIDDDYLSTKYDIAKEEVCILESPLSLYRGDSKGLDDFNLFLSQLNQDHSSDSVQYALIDSIMHIGSFIDYLVVEMFISNTDWPKNNWMVWKDYSNKVNQGRWQWILKDTDYGLGFYNSKASEEDMMEKVKISNGVISSIFSVLIENELFYKKFQLRFREILINEWNENNFIQVVDHYQDHLSNSMSHQIKRWRTHYSIEDWKNEILQLKEFYSKRILFINEKQIPK
jgi:hypothetical protein